MAFHPKALLTEFVSVLDLFNDAVYLNLNGRRNLTTIIGAALSIGLVAVLLYQGISQAVSMYKREDPTIYQIMEYEGSPGEMGLNNTNNFFFAFNTNLDGNVINMSDASLYSFSASFNRYERLADGTRIQNKYPIYMAPCNQSDFPPEIYGSTAFTVNNLNLAFCPTGINFMNTTSGKCPEEVSSKFPDCISTPEFTLTGSYLSHVFQFIQFNLSICDSSDPNLPWGIKCANTDTNVIEQTILDSSSEIDLYYANSMVNPVFYETPNKTLVDNTYWTLNPKIYEISDITVDRVLLQDYDNYLSTEGYTNKTFYSIQTDKLREMQLYQFQTGLPLLTWNMKRSTLTQVTTRTYYKIQDIMTNLGGFSSNLIFVAAFIALGYVRYKYKMILSDELYDFQHIEKPQKKSKKNKKSNNKKGAGIELADRKTADLGESKKSALGDEEHTHDPTAKVVKTYFDQHAKKGKKSRNDFIFFGRFFSMLCCRKKPKNQLAKTAQNLVLEDLDIIKVINKVKEVDKLKLLLLNRYQREAFNFIEKPVIAMEGDQTIYRDSVVLAENKENGELKKGKTLEDFLRLREEKDPYLRYARLYMTYRALREDENLANEKYNKKLVDLMDPDLVQVFKIVDVKIGENPSSKKFVEVVKQLVEKGELYAE